ncbi:MAG TPA: haloacid dehalogenase-like hydrolase [Xanthomonadaceae bacterium]|nr:haloacid dehalogenase-like hydrolase [Xanthomonadaceae bacterium]
MTAPQVPSIPVGGLVVFDFDHTLFRGDSGTGLITWMLRRNPLRLLVAILVSPFIAPLFLWVRARRFAISGYLWIATVLLSGRGDPDVLVAEYVDRNADALRARLLPVALAELRAHRAGGDPVVIATGASAALARAILALGKIEDIPLIGSVSGLRWGGRVTAQHCHGENKLRMLREAGFDALIVRAYSDSTADLPLLRAARQPMVVNPRSQRVAVFRRNLGADVPVLDWGGR